MSAEQLIADFRYMLNEKWGYIPRRVGRNLDGGKTREIKKERLICCIIIPLYFISLNYTK